ncbi:MAG: ATP-binding protein [Acidaminococcaceae bacterium]|nr:ATP-binding protein [Acidaminococcaceae bacterium]
MIEEKSVKLNCVVRGGDFDTAGEASAKIKRMLQRLGIPAAVIRRAAISSYEAELNVIIHADEGELTAEVFPDRTLITVRDRGPGIADIDKALQEGWSTAPDYVRQMGFGAGMGLPNMVKCSDTFEIKSEVGSGTTINMSFAHGEDR